MMAYPLKSRTNRQVPERASIYTRIGCPQDPLLPKQIFQCLVSPTDSQDMARYPIIFFWDPGPCPKKIWDHAKQTMQYEISLPRQEFQFQTELDFEDIFFCNKKDDIYMFRRCTLANSLIPLRFLHRNQTRMRCQTGPVDMHVTNCRVAEVLSEPLS